MKMAVIRNINLSSSYHECTEMEYRHIYTGTFSLNHGARWRRVFSFSLRPLYRWERKEIPIEEGVGWTPWMFCTVWRWKNFSNRDSNTSPSRA
jgi:hypothetical protein